MSVQFMFAVVMAIASAVSVATSISAKAMTCLVSVKQVVGSKSSNSGIVVKSHGPASGRATPSDVVYSWGPANDDTNFGLIHEYFIDCYSQFQVPLQQQF